MKGQLYFVCQNRYVANDVRLAREASKLHNW